ncbi:hypothetical protein [Cedratvirus kamchatka]|uniref:Uncharacterized protein n=1 Tax=Cedratvirus kamchatka TaxID=2716914 RepID=A0A6G8MY33_9VIRU|nr:hypothetical protein [Cedratvirus kamchatka]
MRGYKVFIDYREVRFIGGCELQALNKMKTYLRSRLKKELSLRKAKGYITYKIGDVSSYHNKIKAYRKFVELGVCPRLLDHGVVFNYKVHNLDEGEEEEFNICGYFIETESWGVSLFDKYGLSPLYYPEHIKVQIRNLFERARKGGVCPRNPNPRNVFIRDGVVKITAF